MLKWILICAGLAALLMLAAYSWGRALPSSHVAEGAKAIAAPPELVARWIREVEKQPGWRPGVEAIAVLERSEQELRYREESGHGTIVFRFREVEPDHLFESTIDDAGQPFGGRWLIRIEHRGDASLVSIREEGVVHAPLFRLLGRYVFGFDTTLKDYLDALAKHAAHARAR